MTGLKQVFESLCSNYTDNYQLIEDLWEEIYSAYSEDARKYHNFGHLEFIYDKFEQFQDRLENPDEVLFCLFYHDIVYDFQRQDNEDQSALVAIDRLDKFEFDKPNIDLVASMIRATTTHEPTEDSDTNYFLDFDVAILAEPLEIYLERTAGIRQEYSFYSDEEYHAGRKAVLERFLQKEAIFHTPEFKKNEELARENLRSEIQKYT